MSEGRKLNVIEGKVKEKWFPWHWSVVRRERCIDNVLGRSSRAEYVQSLSKWLQTRRERQKDYVTNIKKEKETNANMNTISCMHEDLVK